jgi:hypothetical protein
VVYAGSYFVNGVVGNCALILSQVNDIEIAYWFHVATEYILFVYILGVMSV